MHTVSGSHACTAPAAARGGLGPQGATEASLSHIAARPPASGTHPWIGAERVTRIIAASALARADATCVNAKSVCCDCLGQCVAPPLAGSAADVESGARCPQVTPPAAHTRGGWRANASKTKRGMCDPTEQLNLSRILGW